MTRKYDVLLLDVDDTLLDFQANEYEALSVVFQAVGCSPTDKARQLYADINHALWARFENGEIDRNTVLSTRFAILFDRLGYAVDGTSVESVYRHELGKGIQLIDGALDLCSVLSRDHRLYIVTNGVYETQMLRLQNSGLRNLVLDVFVSEQVGYQKPSQSFFQYVFDHIPMAIRERMLIVGDSLTSDIQGGVNADIHTCWFNPGKKVNSTPLQPTYEIKSLPQLLSVIYQE